MSLQQILQKNREEYDSKYKKSVLEAYPEYSESHQILLSDIYNWHTSSIKEILQALYDEEQEEISSEERIDTECLYLSPKQAFKEAKQDTLNRLKSLIESL